MQRVKPFFPNEWRIHTGSKEFSWYFCGRPVDAGDGNYKLELPNKIHFFDTTTYTTYKLPNSITKERSVLLASGDRVTSTLLKSALAKNYVGVVVAVPVNKECLNCSENKLCYRAEFAFPKNYLVPTDECDLVLYSKKFSPQIRSVLPTFPTAVVIDECLKKYKCSLVSRVLFEFLEKYYSLLE